MPTLGYADIPLIGDLNNGFSLLFTFSELSPKYGEVFSLPNSFVMTHSYGAGKSTFFVSGVKFESNKDYSDSAYRSIGVVYDPLGNSIKLFVDGELLGDKNSLRSSNICDIPR